MLYYALICFSVACMAVMFSAIFRRGFEQTAPLGAILIVMIVYAAGFVKLARIGIYAAVIISVICMLMSVFISIGSGRGKELFSNVFTVGFVIFVIMAVVIFRLTKDALPADDGNSAYIADIIQKLITDRSFAQAPVSFQSGIGYPPGFAIFVYMFTAFRGELAWTDALRGSYVFMLIMILPVFSQIRWKNAYIAIPAAALVAGAVYIAHPYVPVINTINPDAAAMLVFSMMLVTYMCCEQCGFVYWTLGMGNAMLILTRPGTELLVILMLVLIVIDIAALGFFEVTELFASASKWISVIFYFLITSAVYMSWWIYAGRHGIERFADNITYNSERTLGLAGRIGQVLRAFASGKAIIPYLLWLLVIAVIGAGAALLADGFWNKIRTGIQTVIVILGSFIFMFALAFAYTYVFPVATNIKGTVDIFITGYIAASLIFAVNMLKNKLHERFFTS